MRVLPEHVIARWNEEDWDDEKMIASAYRYEDGETRDPIELSEDELDRYSWGQCVDDLGGGSQGGFLRQSTADVA